MKNKIGLVKLRAVFFKKIEYAYEWYVYSIRLYYYAHIIAYNLIVGDP